MELREIIFAGFTFESIATGRIPFVPMETGFDKVLSNQGISFAGLCVFVTKRRMWV